MKDRRGKWRKDGGRKKDSEGKRIRERYCGNEYRFTSPTPPEGLV